MGSGWSSNLHPTPTIELLQGLRGDAGCMAKARIFVATGTPIQPHDCNGLDGLDIRFRWCVIPEQVIEYTGSCLMCTTQALVSVRYKHMYESTPHRIVSTHSPPQLTYRRCCNRMPPARHRSATAGQWRV